MLFFHFSFFQILLSMHIMFLNLSNKHTEERLILRYVISFCLNIFIIFFIVLYQFLYSMENRIYFSKIKTIKSRIFEINEINENGMKKKSEIEPLMFKADQLRLMYELFKICTLCTNVAGFVNHFATFILDICF